MPSALVKTVRSCPVSVLVMVTSAPGSVPPLASRTMPDTCDPETACTMNQLPPAPTGTTEPQSLRRIASPMQPPLSNRQMLVPHQSHSGTACLSDLCCRYLLDNARLRELGCGGERPCDAHNHGSDTGQIMGGLQAGREVVTGIGTVSSAEGSEVDRTIRGNTGGEGILRAMTMWTLDSGGVYRGSWCPEADADAADG